MAIVQDLEKAVSNLPPEELAKFRSWFEEFDAGAWDEQFEKDAISQSLKDWLRYALDSIMLVFLFIVIFKDKTDGEVKWNWGNNRDETRIDGTG